MHAGPDRRRYTVNVENEIFSYVVFYDAFHGLRTTDRKQPRLLALTFGLRAPRIGYRYLPTGKCFGRSSTVLEPCRIHVQQRMKVTTSNQFGPLFALSQHSLFDLYRG